VENLRKVVKTSQTKRKDSIMLIKSFEGIKKANESKDLIPETQEKEIISVENPNILRARHVRELQGGKPYSLK